MLEAVILDQLERMAAKSSAIQGVTFDYLNRSSSLTVGSIVQFMCDSSNGAAGNIANVGVYSGYASWWTSPGQYAAPYYAAKTKLWFWSAPNNNAGYFVFSFNPDTGAIQVEDNSRKLSGIIEDQAGNVWAVVVNDPGAGVYRRNGVGSWTQVFAGQMAYYLPCAWSDGNIYFKTGAGQWLTPSGSVLTTTTEPSGDTYGSWLYNAGQQFWRQNGTLAQWGPATNSGFNKLAPRISNPSASDAYIAGIVKTSATPATAQQLALLPKEAAEIYARFPLQRSIQLDGTVSPSIDALGCAAWLIVPDSDYYLHIVGLERGTSLLNTNVVVEGKVHIHLSLVNVKTGASQYLGLIERPECTYTRAVAGFRATSSYNNGYTQWQINYIDPSVPYRSPTQLAPLAAQIKNGTLKVFFSSVVTTGEWAVTVMNIDARISI